MERDIWMAVMKVTRSLRGIRKRLRRPMYDDRLMVRLYLWSVLHDRPLCWACWRSSYGRLFRPRRLPSISQFCRRVSEKRFIELLHLVHRRLMQVGIAPALWFIDGKALPVGTYTTDPDARAGYGAGRVVPGYRLHALATDDGRIREFRILSMNHSEAATSLKMVRHIPRDAVVLADGGYDSKHLYNAIEQRGAHLFTRLRGRGRHPKRRISMGHARREAVDAWTSHAALCQQAMARRAQIERIFGTLCSAGGGLAPLPAWVRTLRRVQRWVTAKLIIYHARLDCRLAA